MAKRNDLNTSRSEPNEQGSTAASREQRLVAFAEQLGWVAGTIQAKAEGWLNSEALTAQISRVRDSATALLEQLRPAEPAEPRPAPGAGTSPGGSSDKPARRTTSGDTGKSAARTKVSSKGKVASKVRASATRGGVNPKSGNSGRSGGAVDAPGKKHRKPTPSESAATGAPRGEGARIAKLKAINQNRMQRRG
jgi:hypothetical protein